MIFYPVIRNQIILGFALSFEGIESNRYIFKRYDLKKNLMLDDEWEVELQKEICITVLDFSADNIVILTYDEKCCKYRIQSASDDIVFEVGEDLARCMADEKGNIAVGYNFDEVIQNGGASVIIYNRNGEIVYKYKNDNRALACNDIYIDNGGLLWFHSFGKNSIEKIDEDVITSYECEMSGFDGMVLSADNKYLYVSYSSEAFGDRIFKMEYSEGKYVNAVECEVVLQDNEETQEVKGLSAGYGYGVCILDENKLGIICVDD